MASSTTLFNFPQLSANNYSNWKFRVECIMGERGIQGAIEEDLIKKAHTSEKEKADNLTLDAKAKSVIVQCISDKHIEYIKDATSACDMIEKLKKIFERKSTLTKLFIRRKLMTLKCSDSDDLQDHFMKFDSLIRELEDTGTKVDESDKICHLLLTLPSSYESVIVALETTFEFCEREIT